MKAVMPHLYVGSEQDCRSVAHDKHFARLHACASPCFAERCVQKGLSAPVPSLIEERDDLYLNLHDLSSVMPGVEETIHASMRFIEAHIKTQDVLVHCNVGISRSASLAMLYLAREGVIDNSDFVSARLAFTKIYPNYHPSVGIQDYFHAFWDELLA